MALVIKPNGAENFRCLGKAGKWQYLGRHYLFLERRFQRLDPPFTG